MPLLLMPADEAILSLAGFQPTDDEAKHVRNAMLSEQLKPTGEFVACQRCQPGIGPIAPKDC